MSKPTGKKRWLFWLTLPFHSLFLVVLTFALIQSDFVHGDEAFLIKYTSVTLRTLLPEPDKPELDDFAFINVAYDKQLVTRIDADGMNAGNQQITDRRKLTRLFNVLNKDPNYKALFCDVFFADTSSVDSALGAEIDQLPRAFYSCELNDTGGLWPPVFEGAELGLSNFTEVEDAFLKFRVLQEGYPSVPVKLFELLDGGSFEEGVIFHRLNGKPAFNDFVLDFRIRTFDLKKDTLNYPYANLYDLEPLWLYGMEEEILNFTKDRIVVIGDFEVGDMHETMYGDMPGPLILLNIYLSLKNGDNLIPTWFIIYLFVVFFGLSWMVFSQDDALEDWLDKKLEGKSKFLRTLASGASYMVLLGVASMLSFLLFNIHINFLLLSFYFGGLEWFRNWLRKRKEAKISGNAAKA